MRAETPTDRLKWVARYFGCSQKIFAAEIGVGEGCLSNWMQAAAGPSLRGALLVHKRYGVSPDFLFLGLTGNLPKKVREAWERRP